MAKEARRRIDGEVKAGFVAALRAGVGRDEAAKRQGFSAEAFYCARARDALFRSAWIWALELSAVEEREARRAGEMAAAAEHYAIQPNNQRPMQRRMRGIKFTEARQQMFLDHFAGTADVMASCDAAGIHYSTAYKYRRNDPVFAAGWEAALAQAYAVLEAETLRQRLAAQRRAAIEPNPSGEMNLEFERVMKLLARRDGRNGGSGKGIQARWSFDDAIEALDQKLRALGARRALPPPSDGARQ